QDLEQRRHHDHRAGPLYGDPRRLHPRFLHGYPDGRADPDGHPADRLARQLAVDEADEEPPLSVRAAARALDRRLRGSQGHLAREGPDGAAADPGSPDARRGASGAHAEGQRGPGGAAAVRRSPMSPNDVAVPKEFLERIPLRFARENAVLAIGPNTLALGKPDRVWAADRIAYKLDRECTIVEMEEARVLELINHAYHAQAKEVAQVAQELKPDEETGEVVLAEDVLDLDDKAPAVKLVHAALLQAIKQRASDIHVEPGEAGLRVRFRVDGVLYDRAILRRDVQDGVVSRIKVMAKMDIAERRLPQDGGVTVRVGDRRIDLRIATLPSQHGERVVMRLLDKTTGLLSLGHLGFAAADLQRVNRILELLHGIILVTGPTGSGKTTSLYAMLSSMNSNELNILTLEDPIEYQLPGVTQTQVNAKKGLTFAKGLRSIVRQDPDIIMVGEIRDLETATIAIQSSLTGHL